MIKSLAELLEERENIVELTGDLPFRRGYVHGYLEAIRAIEQGYGLRDLLAFAEIELNDWRTKRLHEKVVPPFISTR